jgi:hypothetical protein
VSDVVGVYDLESVNGNGIPYVLPSGMEITGGFIELRENGTFTKTVESNQISGWMDLSTWGGTFALIAPDTVRFNPGAGSFLPAALGEEFSGTVNGKTITVVETRPDLVDWRQRLLYRRS